MGLTEPLVGWRAWRIVMDEEAVLLRGITHHVVWPPGEALEATCTQCQRHFPETPVPQESHECGMYGFWSKRPFVPYMLARSPIAIGFASYWGRVIQHEDGFRAQYAYPLELWVMPVYIVHGVNPHPAFLSQRTLDVFTRGLRQQYSVEVSVADSDLVHLATSFNETED